jgi:hypothetical protein
MMLFITTAVKTSDPTEEFKFVFIDLKWRRKENLDMNMENPDKAF